MMHDLLSAVKGCGGDMFVWKEDHTFQITNDLGLLHPCEVAIIEEMMVIASHYRQIMEFCDTYDVVQVNTDLGQRCGVYLCSLAWSVRRAVVRFPEAVVGVEEQLLVLPSLPLTSALAAIQPLDPTLATLHAMLKEIENKQVFGCKILEVLHKYATNSVAQIKQVLMRVEQDVHSVLYDQLTHWLLHGLLLDPHQEFFITTNNNQEAVAAEELDGLSLDEGSSVSGDSGIVREACLRVELLPSHIPHPVARKILFVGEAILVFKQRSKDGICAVEEGGGGVWGGRESELEELLRKLGEEHTFSLPRLTHAITTIAKCVSQALWEVVVEGGVVGVLGEVKGVYLLGRGELYQALLPTLTPYLTSPLPPTLAKVNGLFQAAGRQVLVEDSLLEKFTLSLAPAQEKHKPESVWNRLKVEYQAKWPLHCLLNPSTQDKYSTIFRFLVGVRRAQHRLQQLWMTQMRTSKYREGSGGSLQWTLRHHMTLLIDNIQYYLQVDVLESEHWQLVAAIVSGERDYQHLAHAHSAFLASVAARCFLHHPILSATISHLLTLIHKFCAIVEARGTGHVDGASGKQGKVDVTPTKTSHATPHSQSSHTTPHKSSTTEKASELQEVGAALERVAAQLFFVLSNLRLYHGSQHTAQLIMRMDYNKYYSKNETVRRFKASVTEGE